MDSYYKFFPAEGQIDPTACWAACLRWWMYSVRSILKKQEEFIDLYEFNDDGTISKKTMLKILSDPRWGMKKDVFQGSKFTTGTVKKLLEKSPIYAGYTDPETRTKHVNVIYDMEVVGGVTKIAVMEPQAILKEDWSYDGAHQIKNLRDFSRYGSVYAGTLRA